MTTQTQTVSLFRRTSMLGLFARASRPFRTAVLNTSGAAMPNLELTDPQILGLRAPVSR